MAGARIVQLAIVVIYMIVLLIIGKKSGRNVICNNSEKRRHKTASDIGTGHLDSDNRLGFIDPEMRRS